MLGNTGAAEDVAVFGRALDELEPLVREHAACVLRAVSARPARESPGLDVPETSRRADGCPG
ncbi:MAG TPA: hypothetical protein VFS08_16960 [Gemmatimonadaceae bacterium]|nr:hypothetical protein [Gemmatimonadaceae bacterium]